MNSSQPANHFSKRLPACTLSICALDKTDRKKLLNDIRRYLAEKEYYVQAPVGQTTVATQPWVKGFYYESDYGRGAEYVTKVWLDGKPAN